MPFDPHTLAERRQLRELPSSSTSDPCFQSGEHLLELFRTGLVDHPPQERFVSFSTRQRPDGPPFALDAECGARDAQSVAQVGEAEGGGYPVLGRAGRAVSGGRLISIIGLPSPPSAQQR